MDSEWVLDFLNKGDAPSCGLTRIDFIRGVPEMMTFSDPSLQQCPNLK